MIMPSSAAMNGEPTPNAGLRDVERALISATGFEAGIVPIENPEHDFSRILAQLPADEALRLKRKFRKLWRKAAKEDRLHFGPLAVGMGSKAPTRAQKQQRKRIVFRMLWRDIVAPAIERFESGKQYTSGDV